MGVLVISPLPSFLLESLPTAGPLCSTAITAASSLLRARPPPSRLPSFSRWSPFYYKKNPEISPWDEEGFSSCLMRPCHRAVANTPPSGSPLQSVCDAPCCLHPAPKGS